MAAGQVRRGDHRPSPTSPSFCLVGRAGLLVRFDLEKGFHCFKQVEEPQTSKSRERTIKMCLRLGEGVHRTLPLPLCYSLSDLTEQGPQPLESLSGSNQAIGPEDVQAAGDLRGPLLQHPILEGPRDAICLSWGPASR